ncbi:MAG TPA: purine-nucleoside phosphorylase [Acidimicrobiia bacterium]|nr:purine-nucleoside phosphorylase [Acidimicrobiia bacterium]
MSYEELQAAAAVVRERTGRPLHRVALVLGSGLNDYGTGLPGAVAVPYADLPGFPVPRVEGHGGTLYSVEPGGIPVMVLAGRVHTYEGWPLEKVVFAVRTAVLCGCRTVVLTNASGGAGEGLAPGDLVLIRDHINLSGRNPLVGANDDRLGPRFPDMSAVYPAELRRVAREAAARAGVELKEGVYAWFLGPSFETPSEVQMARRLGADLVGMSTVPEAIAVRHMGGQVLGISLVTNLAAGISPVPLSHEEVQQAGAAARDRFGALLDALLPALGA